VTTYFGSETGAAPPPRRRPLSPEQIRQARFTRTGIGRRGYHEPEVDELLGRLAGDVDGWIAETTNLRAENQRLKSALRDWQSQHVDRSANAQVPSRAPDLDAVNLLSRAQQEADSVVAQAQDYARRLTEHAQQRYDEVLRAAQQQAHEEAERAAQSYRARSGSRYTAAFEELERRLAWTRTFLDAIQGVETQLKTAREALAWEVQKLGDLDPGTGTQ
jgi:cell division initiation protein